MNLLPQCFILTVKQKGYRLYFILDVLALCISLVTGTGVSVLLAPTVCPRPFNISPAPISPPLPLAWQPSLSVTQVATGAVDVDQPIGQDLGLFHITLLQIPSMRSSLSVFEQIHSYVFDSLPLPHCTPCLNMARCSSVSSVLTHSRPRESVWRSQTCCSRWGRDGQDDRPGNVIIIADLTVHKPNRPITDQLHVSDWPVQSCGCPIDHQQQLVVFRPIWAQRQSLKRSSCPLYTLCRHQNCCEVQH